jgi:hypothetical protein
MVAVPVLYKTTDQGPGLPGGYVVHPPLTTEEARCGGAEFYGFPRFLAEITFEDAGPCTPSRGRRCSIYPASVCPSDRRSRTNGMSARPARKAS